MSSRTRNGLDTPPDLSTWSPHGSGQATGPLTTLQLRKLNQAGIQQKKLTRAIKIASFNGMCTAIFAAVALVGGIFSTLSLAMGLALAGLAWNEFRGRNFLREMHPLAPRVLGWNQMAFMGLLILYSAWNIYFGLTGPSAYAAEIAAHPQLDTMFGLTRLEKMVTVSIYSTMIVGTIICQGGCAWYYFSRAKHLHAYIADTEPWILDIQRAGHGT